ncbi:hypothetical protein [Jannaschia sp. 2305UL9-9]|uniref:hypothetical protein n=1 Tax=Jannaschia sp. 2305UL9-9 TaxID=3121638 RepID=UPI0035290372
MTIHDPLSPASQSTGNPGGATVADLRALDSLQSLIVLMFRDWCDGPDGQQRVTQVFQGALGRLPGDTGLAAWIEMMAILSDDVRRPVMRHALTCRCVGADEAVIAQVLSLAGQGEREEAMLVLSLLVSGDRLLMAVNAAERAGLACMRINLRAPHVAGVTPPATTRLH